MSSTNAQDTVSKLDAISPSDFAGDEAARYQVKEAARRLLNRMQTPFERSYELSMDNPAVCAAVQVGLDTGVFQGWLEAGGNEASLTDLVGFCKVKPEENLLRRLFRLLACFNVVEESGEDRWKPTEYARELGKPEGPIAQTVLWGTHHMIDSYSNLPSFLAKTAYRDPVDPSGSNYMDTAAYRGVDFFARCGSDPKYQASFINGMMTGLVAHKADWTDVFDTKGLVDGFDGTGACFVDMGGGHGVDPARLLAKHPDLPAGSLVLQDLADVIEMAKGKVDPKIKAESHDFFKPQSIQGSRAYYMHAVLHDWNDTDVCRILKNITPAMKKGYSKILMYENVLPPTGAMPLQATLDLCLLDLLSAGERSEATWKKLLGECGLNLVKIWKHPTAIESVIEAELA